MESPREAAPNAENRVPLLPILPEIIGFKAFQYGCSRWRLNIKLGVSRSIYAADLRAGARFNGNFGLLPLPRSKSILFL